MKKLFTIAALMVAMVVPGVAQNDDDNNGNMTLDDILNEQDESDKNSFAQSHFDNVWKRKTYLNLSYSKTTLAPKDDAITVMDGLPAPDYKSQVGVGLTVGRSYRLHKKAIGNVAQIYLDWTFVDLGFNTFKAEDGEYLYDSSESIVRDASASADSDPTYKMPWDMKKYEASYGMALGPSVTFAPFTSAKAEALHYLQLHLYYRFGYHASGLYIDKDDAKDRNVSPATAEFEEAREKMDDQKLLYGLGTTSTFGASLTWKFVGIGFEHCVMNQKYRAIDSDVWGKEKSKFKTSSNRIYLQFRF